MSVKSSLSKERMDHLIVVSRLARWYAEDARRGKEDPVGRDAALNALLKVNQEMRNEIAALEAIERASKGRT